MGTSIEDGLVLNLDPSQYDEALRSAEEVLFLKCFALDHIGSNCIVFLTNKRLKVFRLQNFFQHFGQQLPRYIVHELFGSLVVMGYEVASSAVEEKRIKKIRQGQHRWIAPFTLENCESRKMETLLIPFDNCVYRFKQLEIRNINGGAQLRWQLAGFPWSVKGLRSNLIHTLSPRSYDTIKAIARSAVPLLPDDVAVAIAEDKIVVVPMQQPGSRNQP
jgi:hypothetical protein